MLNVLTSWKKRESFIQLNKECKLCTQRIRLQILLKIHIGDVCVFKLAKQIAEAYCFAITLVTIVCWLALAELLLSWLVRTHLIYIDCNNLFDKFSIWVGENCQAFERLQNPLKVDLPIVAKNCPRRWFQSCKERTNIFATMYLLHFRFLAFACIFRRQMQNWQMELTTRALQLMSSNKGKRPSFTAKSKRVMSCGKFTKQSWTRRRACKNKTRHWSWILISSLRKGMVWGKKG